MDKSQCQQLVEEHLYSMSRFMSICEWTITASSEPKSSNKKFMRAARVDSRLDYLTATITLNPEAYQDDDDFLDSLYHELCHLVIAPFDLYRETAREATADGANNSLDRIYTYAMERVIKTMEFTWKCHGVKQLYLDQFTNPNRPQD
jgi:predicted SprT family Zn-dependent metalloprotease